MTEDYTALVDRLRSRDAEEMLVRDPRQAADVIEKLSADRDDWRDIALANQGQWHAAEARLARAEDCIEKIRYGSIPTPIAIANYKNGAHND